MTNKTLERYRIKIDLVDQQIITLLSDRMKTSLKIGKYKNRNKLPIQDKTRELEMISRYIKMATLHRLNPNYIKKLYAIILSQSRSVQAKKGGVINERKS